MAESRSLFGPIIDLTGAVDDEGREYLMFSVGGAPVILRQRFRNEPWARAVEIHAWLGTPLQIVLQSVVDETPGAHVFVSLHAAGRTQTPRQRTETAVGRPGSLSSSGEITSSESCDLPAQA